MKEWEGAILGCIPTYCSFVYGTHGRGPDQEDLVLTTDETDGMPDFKLHR